MFDGHGRDEAMPRLYGDEYKFILK